MQDALLHKVSDMAVLKDIHENVHSSFMGNWISGLFCFSFLLSLFLRSFKWNVCTYFFNKIFQMFILKVSCFLLKFIVTNYYLQKERERTTLN